ncbi:MAG: preprotein translocase subunit SecY [Candidatus Hydrogenedentota bacterium]
MSQPIEAFRNAFKIPELKNRIFFTLLMLAIYRLGAHVPTPGVDGAALANQLQSAGGLLGFYDMFTGGAFANATVFALGIMPYITASIIFSLLIPVIPALEQLQKQGQEGQRKITEYTRFATIGLCIIQGFMIALYMESLNSGNTVIVPNPGWGFRLMAVLTLTTGTAFIMWLGEQISEYGVGNGISLIIFISIISRLPSAMFNLVRMLQVGEMSIFQVLILVVLLVLVVAGAIVVTTGQRRIPVQYPRQIRGRGVVGGQRTYLPLRVNQAGVIPIIFASSILMVPGSLSQSVNIPWLEAFLSTVFDWTGIWYNLIYAGLIIFFCFFYTALTFNPVEVADNMKKYGGVIVGVRPGKATADYLHHVMTRITLVGAIFLAGVALMPPVVYAMLEVPDPTVVQFFGGTSLLIMVGVALDTIRQIEQHLVMRHYDGFGVRGRRIRARRGF